MQSPQIQMYNPAASAAGYYMQTLIPQQQQAFRHQPLRGSMNPNLIAASTNPQSGMRFNFNNNSNNSHHNRRVFPGGDSMPRGRASSHVNSPQFAYMEGAGQGMMRNTAAPLYPPTNSNVTTNGSNGSTNSTGRTSSSSHPPASSSSSGAALHVRGQEPLTATALASASKGDQKQMLGERIYPLIQEKYPTAAGKITGMLLEMDNTEILHLLEDADLFQSRVDEAVLVLQMHQTKKQPASQSN